MNRSKRPHPSAIKRLEELITIVGGSSVEGGTFFVQLCALLLQAMGFTDIYIRKGTEIGRDIDAKFSGQNWYFECKRYSKYIDTPEMAYKFLQLEMLTKSLQPDFFVLISNAAMKAILKDIVQFKKADQSVKYSVETWVNDPENPTFNHILLSYPEVYVDFLKRTTNLKGKWFDDLVTDFQTRSKQYLEKNPAFFEGIRKSIAVIKQMDYSKPVEHSAKFYLDHTLYLTQRTLRSRGWSLVIVACPARPISGLYDFDDMDSLSPLYKTLAQWGVQIVRRHDSCVEFAENASNRTLFFDFGAIVTVTPILYLNTVEPSEWLKALREDCLRMRNFAKRGILMTPVLFRAYVTNLMYPSWMDKNSLGPQFFGGLDRFFPENALSKSYKGMQIDAAGVGSDDILFNAPPNMHTEIGRTLATSLWRNAGMKTPFLQAAKETEDTLDQRLKTYESGSGTKNSIVESAHFRCAVEFERSLGWLLRGELFDRSYEFFDNVLKEP
jgi:hypothetical protein